MTALLPVLGNIAIHVSVLAENDAMSGALRGGLRGALIGGGIGAVVGLLGYVFKKKK